MTETLDVVNDATVWKDENGIEYILAYFRGCDAIHTGQPESIINQSMLRENGCQVDDVATRHSGIQRMIIKDVTFNINYDRKRFKYYIH